MTVSEILQHFSVSSEGQCLFQSWHLEGEKGLQIQSEHPQEAFFYLASAACGYGSH